MKITFLLKTSRNIIYFLKCLRCSQPLGTHRTPDHGQETETKVVLPYRKPSALANKILQGIVKEKGEGDSKKDEKT